MWERLELRAKKKKRQSRKDMTVRDLRVLTTVLFITVVWAIVIIITPPKAGDASSVAALKLPCFTLRLSKSSWEEKRKANLSVTAWRQSWWSWNKRDFKPSELRKLKETWLWMDRTSGSTLINKAHAGWREAAIVDSSPQPCLRTIIMFLSRSCHLTFQCVAY